MLTCCPACRTTFRVTPEQIKARAGKVRCGKCQEVFNALDTLIETPAGDLPPTPPAATVAAPARETPVTDDSPAVTAPAPPAEVPERSPADAADALPALPAIGEAPDEIQENADIQRQKPEISGETIDILLEPVGTGSAPVAPPAPETPPLSADAIRDKALAAGLVAARESTQVPGYNKWAEGAFTGTTAIAEPAAHPRWPFVLTALLLIVALAGQAAHHFRAELAVASPSLRPVLDALCAALGCDIPLPRHSELVSIESSDLQIDPARGGLLTLSATLKNRAAYAQAWPLLELTLTDVRDDAVLRRVLEPADYLPAKLDPTVFPPNGEVGIRLWLEAKDVAAAGYRLYVFYP